MMAEVFLCICEWPHLDPRLMQCNLCLTYVGILFHYFVTLSVSCLMQSIFRIATAGCGGRASAAD